MAPFTKNPSRLDPYKNFKFQLQWDNKIIAGVSKVGALKRTTEVVKHRAGGDPSTSHKSPGRTEYDAITLDRGVTHDKEFQQWANMCWKAGGKQTEVILGSFRKEIILNILNESGQVVISYKIHRCWISEYQATADLDANANAVLIEHIKLENEGWERDESVQEPVELSLAPPA